MPTWSIGERLRKIRRDYLHMSQESLANNLDVTKERYSAWETGRNQPKGEEFVRVALAMEELATAPGLHAWILGLPVPRGGDTLSITSEYATLITEVGTRNQDFHSAPVSQYVPPRRTHKSVA